MIVLFNLNGSLFKSFELEERVFKDDIISFSDTQSLFIVIQTMISLSAIGDGEKAPKGEYIQTAFIKQHS